MGFDPLVNQRLLPPTFPRYTKIKSREEALDYFDALIQRLKIVTKISSYTAFHGALVRVQRLRHWWLLNGIMPLQDFFIEFSRTSPCILSRSILQLLYLPHYNRVLGAHNFTDVLREAAKTFICPPALMPKSTLLNNQQVHTQLAYFHV